MVFGFKKKRSETIDFTKLPDARVHRTNTDFKKAGDFVDLTDESAVAEQPVQASSGSSTGSQMDFLNTMASSTSSSSGSSQPDSEFSSSNVVTQVSEMSELKHKLRNVTGKLEDNENQIYRLMQKIELLERKIERFENRGV